MYKYNRKIFLNSKGHSCFLIPLKGGVPLLSFIFCNQDNQIVPLVRKADCHWVPSHPAPSKQVPAASRRPLKGRKCKSSLTWGCPPRITDSVDGRRKACLPFFHPVWSRSPACGRVASSIASSTEESLQALEHWEEYLVSICHINIVVALQPY